ncbi:MAG TPA: DUF3455 domain-containing protein [Polyangiaceae bacterium]|nr:DUF3455 domain-containing protein [Polyangiaceae bacterium]
MLRFRILAKVPALAVALAASSCTPEAVPPATAPAAPPSAASPMSAAPSSSAPPAPIAPPATPDAIAVAGAPVLLKAAAKGVQVYACKAKEAAPSTFEWTLTGPDAQLFDDRGQPIGKHYAGPTWELTDGSKVIGKLHGKVDAPDPNAIPWLSLDAKETQGSGLLTHVKNIQRVATAGGKAPATGCDAAHAGAETRVDYTATYYFYGS